MKSFTQSRCGGSFFFERVELRGIDKGGRTVVNFLVLRASGGVY